MSEVSAEKIDRRGAGDPTAAARRRTMTIKLKHARQFAHQQLHHFSGQYARLVRLFANSVDERDAGDGAGRDRGWRHSVLVGSRAQDHHLEQLCSPRSLAVRYGLGVAFFDTPEAEKASAAWRRKFVAAETFAGATWAMLVVLLRQSPNPDAVNFVLIVLMLVSGMTAMVASAIPVAVGGGLLPIMIAIVSS